MGKTYNVGVIGTAWAARSPLPVFQTYERTNLLAVCSARLERAKATAEQFGAQQAFDDFNEMVKLPELDIVYVGGPVYLHHPMVMAALQAGKHVLSEKPLALNVAEAREMLDAAESRGLKHVVAFTMRHYPWSWKVKSLIDEGFLGDLRHVNITQFFGFPIMPPPGGAQPGANGGGGRPQQQSGQTSQTWTWVHDASLGGGMLGAMGSHYADLINWWFGGLEQVSGSLRTWRTEMPTDSGEMKPVTADDAFAYSGVLKTDQALFTMHFSANVRAATGSRVEIYGSKGSIVVENASEVKVGRPWDRVLEAVDAPELDWPDTVGQTAVPRFGLMVSNLIRAIEEPGFVARPNLEDGLRCQEILDAVSASNATGQTVRVGEPVRA